MDYVIFATWRILLDIVPALRRVRPTSLTERPCLAVMRTGGPWASVGTTLVLGPLVSQLDRLELLLIQYLFKICFLHRWDDGAARGIQHSAVFAGYSLICDEIVDSAKLAEFMASFVAESVYITHSPAHLYPHPHHRMLPLPPSIPASDISQHKSNRGD